MPGPFLGSFLGYQNGTKIDPKVGPKIDPQIGPKMMRTNINISIFFKIRPLSASSDFFITPLLDLLPVFLYI